MIAISLRGDELQSDFIFVCLKCGVMVLAGGVF